MPPSSLTFVLEATLPWFTPSHINAVRQTVCAAKQERLTHIRSRAEQSEGNPAVSHHRRPQRILANETRQPGSPD